MRAVGRVPSWFVLIVGALGGALAVMSFAFVARWLTPQAPPVITAPVLATFPLPGPRLDPRAVRPPHVADARASAVLALAKSVAAPNGDLEGPPGALAAFFAELDRLAAGVAHHHVNVVVFGNSLIAGDNITNVLRERLSQRFGDGGRGLVLADRVADYGTRSRAALAEPEDWDAFNIAMGPAGPAPYGLAGAYHQAAFAGARSEWRLSGETRARLFWRGESGGATVELRVDGTSRWQATPRAGARSVELVLGPSAKRLELIAGAGALIDGIALERDAPGITLDTIGLAGAEASRFLQTDATLSAAQLAARAPSLVAFLLGGNEMRRFARGRTNLPRLANELASLITRTRKAAPHASCLVIGPIDAVEGEGDSVEPTWRSRPEVARVTATERDVARAQGCAFFDLFHAMGGEGALGRFDARGFVNEDRVHPQGKGLDLLGEMVADAVLRSYAAPEYPSVAREDPVRHASVR